MEKLPNTDKKEKYTVEWDSSQATRMEQTGTLLIGDKCNCKNFDVVPAHESLEFRRSTPTTKLEWSILPPIMSAGNKQNGGRKEWKDPWTRVAHSHEGWCKSAYTLPYCKGEVYNSNTLPIGKVQSWLLTTRNEPLEKRGHHNYSVVLARPQQNSDEAAQNGHV